MYERDQIRYNRGSLTICNPNAELVSSITLKIGKKDAKHLLKNLKEQCCTSHKVEPLSKEKTITNITSQEYLEASGFVAIGTFDGREIYIGRLVEKDVDDMVIHSFKEGKSLKQVFLSPIIHGQESNAEYLNNVLSKL